MILAIKRKYKWDVKVCEYENFAGHKALLLHGD